MPDQNQFLKSIVRVRNASNRGISGTGVLISSRHILTCAHVVAAALNTGKRTNLTGRELEVDFPFIENTVAYRVRVVRWPDLPPEDGQDLAGLEFIDAPPNSAVFARLRVLNLLENFAVKIGGFPREFERGQWFIAQARGPSGDIVQFNITEKFEYSIEKGYSGAPVWHIDSGDVAGIVVKVDEGHDRKSGYFIPVENIRRFWSEVVDAISWENQTYEYAAYISYYSGWDEAEKQNIRKFVENLRRHLTSKLSMYTTEVQKIYYDTTRLENADRFFNPDLAAKLCRSACMIVIGVPAYFRSHPDCAREMRTMQNLEQYRGQLAGSPIPQLIIPVIFAGERHLPPPFIAMGRRRYAFDEIHLRNDMDTAEAQQMIYDIAEDIFDCCDKISEYSNLFACQDIPFASDSQLDEWRRQYARQRSSPASIPMRGLQP